MESALGAVISYWPEPSPDAGCAEDQAEELKGELGDCISTIHLFTFKGRQFRLPDAEGKLLCINLLNNE